MFNVTSSNMYILQISARMTGKQDSDVTITRKYRYRFEVVSLGSFLCCVETRVLHFLLVMGGGDVGTKWKIGNMHVFVFSCLKFTRKLKNVCFHVFSPFSASFYPHYIIIVTVMAVLFQ